MTYQKPLNILLSGNTCWNTWQQTDAEVQAFQPDLHEVDLHQAQLRGIDFHAVDLTGANLQHADLSGADAREADLRHTDLRDADLLGVNWKKTLLDEAQFNKVPASTEDFFKEGHQDTLLETPEQRLARAVPHAA